MSTRVLHVQAEAQEQLRDGIASIQRELGVDPAFAADVEAAARTAAENPRLPELDLTDLPFVTIDPPGARDLDQAMHLSREGERYVVHYAIADVAAFVDAGDPVDEEAHERGESLYAADNKVPLHPTVLSEGAASLLPGEIRPAFVWTLTLEKSGAVSESRVERALVRSTEQLDYETVQNRGEGDPLFDLLKEIGELRIQQEIARGGVNLPLPEQEIVVEGDRWRLEFRTMLPVEGWNAQISLMTGFAAAQMMLEQRVGLLRTLPKPAEEAVTRLRRTAKALDIAWPTDEDYSAFIRRLDPSEPKQAAMVVASTSLLRGAGYVAFQGDLPEQHEHAALASPYAHCTAPLRRLVDRYALEICAAITAGSAVPDWVFARIDDLPALMQESGRRASSYENAVLDLVEALTLQDQVGQKFDAVILEVDEEDPQRAAIQLSEPAVEAAATGANAGPGAEVTVTLSEADPANRKIAFTL